MLPIYLQRGSPGKLHSLTSLSCEKADDSNYRTNTLLHCVDDFFQLLLIENVESTVWRDLKGVHYPLKNRKKGHA